MGWCPARSTNHLFCTHLCLQPWRSHCNLGERECMRWGVKELSEASRIRGQCGRGLGGVRGLKGPLLVTGSVCLVGREASKETAWLRAWATGCWGLGMGPRMQKKSPERLAELGGGSWKPGQELEMGPCCCDGPSVLDPQPCSGTPLAHPPAHRKKGVR